MLLILDRTSVKLVRLASWLFTNCDVEYGTTKPRTHESDPSQCLQPDKLNQESPALTFRPLCLSLHVTHTVIYTSTCTYS